MKILLGVTGSISAYRALDICRELTKYGVHQVKVILTRGAEEFVHHKTFYYLGASQVYRWSDDFNPEKEPTSQVIHIDLIKWCDRLIIAPASANTIAKFANGLCDDLLSSCFLALGKKICVLFPAMNTNMLEHPMTQKNLELLRQLPNAFIHPADSGELACGDIGAGKLPKVQLISEVAPLVSKKKPGQKVMITTGATISALDPVRFLTNPASGITGYELAKLYLLSGAHVTLIHGYQVDKKIHFLKDLPNIELVEAKTTSKMLQEVQTRFEHVDIYISSAAINDIVFDTQDSKLKKNDFDSHLKITSAPDVLQTVLKNKKHQKVVGFAAETDCSLNILKAKWDRKPVDLLVGNKVNNGIISEKKGFGVNVNDYYFFKDGQIIYTQSMTKKELAQKIMDELND